MAGQRVCRRLRGVGGRKGFQLVVQNSKGEGESENVRIFWAPCAQGLDLVYAYCNSSLNV